MDDLKFGDLPLLVRCVNTYALNRQLGVENWCVYIHDVCLAAFQSLSCMIPYLQFVECSGSLRRIAVSKFVA